MGSYPGYRFGWRISATEADLPLGSLRAYRIPPPEPAEYQDFTERRSKSDGGEGRYGYSFVRWFFSEMTRQQGSEFKEIILAAEAAADVIYLTVDRSNGDSMGPDWIDVKGKPSMPDFSPRYGKIYEDIVFRVNAVEIVNDPATF